MDLKESLLHSREKCGQPHESVTFRNSVLVLDEVDYLKDPRMKVLETVFRWPNMANMCIIGISNTPELLQALPHGPPPDVEVLHFRPYTEAEIAGVLLSRLEDAGHDKALAPGAISQIAKNISNHSADMRKALGYCEKAMSNVERQESGKDQVSVVDVLKVMANEGGAKLVPDIFGAKSHRITREQKILVACLLLLLKNRREKRVTVLQLFECFKLELKKYQFDEVTESSCIGEIL